MLVAAELGIGETLKIWVEAGEDVNQRDTVYTCNPITARFF